jgi:flagellin-specific chaperone FliS
MSYNDEDTDYKYEWKRRLENLKKAQNFIEEHILKMDNEDVGKCQSELNGIYKKLMEAP